MECLRTFPTGLKPSEFLAKTKAPAYSKSLKTVEAEIRTSGHVLCGRRLHVCRTKGSAAGSAVRPRELASPAFMFAPGDCVQCLANILFRRRALNNISKCVAAECDHRDHLVKESPDTSISISSGPCLSPSPNSSSPLYDLLAGRMNNGRFGVLA